MLDFGYVIYLLTVVGCVVFAAAFAGSLVAALSRQAWLGWIVAIAVFVALDRMVSLVD